MQSLKSAGVRRCQSQSQSRSELDQVARNGSLVVFSCFRKSKEATGIEHGLREELLLSPQIGFDNYPSRKTFATHFL